MASDTLRSALQTYAVASELTETASVTYEASFDAYQNGLGTITDITIADSGLLDARQARADANAPSLIAAATLAFSLGSLTQAP